MKTFLIVFATIFEWLAILSVVVIGVVVIYTWYTVFIGIVCLFLVYWAIGVKITIKMNGEPVGYIKRFKFYPVDITKEN